MEILDNCLKDYCWHSVQQRLCVLKPGLLILVVTFVKKFVRWFRCLTCATLFKRTSNIKRHLPICEELVENVNPKTVNQLRETLLDILSAFKFDVTEGTIFFNNFAGFGFDSDSFVLKTSILIERKTTAWVGKYDQLLHPWPIICSTNHFLYVTLNPSSHSLVSTSKTSRENFEGKTRFEMDLKFLKTATTIVLKLERVISTVKIRKKNYQVLSIMKAKL